MGAIAHSPVLSYHQGSSLSKSALRSGSMAWRDRPSYPKWYSGLPRITLPAPPDLGEASFAGLCASSSPGSNQGKALPGSGSSSVPMG